MSASAPCTLSVISAEDQEGKPDHQPGAVKGRPLDIPPKGPQTLGVLGPHFENCWFRGTLQAAEGACCWLFPGGSWRRWDLAGWAGGETQPRSGASARPVGEAASKGGVRTLKAMNPNGGGVCRPLGEHHIFPLEGKELESSAGARKPPY